MKALAGLLCALLAGPALAQPAIEKIATGFRFTEGPAWPREGYLVFSDIPSDRLLRYTPGASVTLQAGDSGGANGNAFDAEGRLYSCEGRRQRLVRRARDGTLGVLAKRFEGKRLNAPNDIVVRRDGHAWFTDPAFGRTNTRRELDFYGIFHLAPDGTLETISRWTTRPNGIALSPGGDRLYVADSDAQVVRSFALDAAGRASDEMVAVWSIEGVPDGLKVDAAGNLFVAGRGVMVYTPGGLKIAEVALPETPANLAFGDADLKSLYVTARTSLYRVRLNAPGWLPY